MKDGNINFEIMFWNSHENKSLRVTLESVQLEEFEQYVLIEVETKGAHLNSGPYPIYMKISTSNLNSSVVIRS